MMAICSEYLAILGRCSQILTPGVSVCVSLKVPPLAVPGFKSKVSIWLGPPFIHKRMHDLRRGSGADASARPSSHPEAEPPSTPSAESLNQSRREINGADMVISEEWLLSG